MSHIDNFIAMIEDSDFSYETIEKDDRIFIRVDGCVEFLFSTITNRLINFFILDEND